jgi:MFS family permease
MSTTSPSDPAAAAGPAAPGGRRASMGTIFLTLFLDLVGFSIIFPLSPSMLEYYLKLEGSQGILGSIIRVIESASPLAGQDKVYTAALFGGVLGAIYSLLQFFFSPIWGSLSDRTGRRPILIISIAGTAASYLLWAMSGSFLLFIASRFLAGAMGGNLSVATAAAADVTTRAERTKAMGLVGAAFGLGFTFGPAIGGSLSRIDMTKQFPSLAAYGLNPFSAAALGAFFLGALNLFQVITRFDETLRPEDRRRPAERRPLNPAVFFRRSDIPGVRSVNIIYFIYLLAFGGMEFTLTFLAHQRFRYTPFDIMWLFVFIGVLMALVQGGLVRRVAPRIGERRMAIVGLVTVLPGFLLIGLAPSPFILYVGLAFMGLGSGLVNPAFTSLVSLYAPPDRQGSVMGVFRSIGSFSRILGPLIATLAFWRFGSSSPYILGAAILIPPLLMTFRLPPPHGRETPAAGG